MKELLEYWKQFGNVPVNDNDEIEESFLHFDKGTDRIEVWQWFESKHPDFSVAKLLSGEHIMSQYISEAPNAVQKAYAHVRMFFPAVTRVTFDKDCRWCYTDESGNLYSFDGLDIETNILEDAADAQYNIGVPAVYIEFPEKVLSKSEIPNKPTVTLTQVDVSTYDINCGVACVSFDFLEPAVREFAFQVEAYQA